MKSPEQDPAPSAARIPSIPSVPPPETVIWRYIDFAKLVSMLHSRTLYFSRIDQFVDRYEGVFAGRTIERFFRAAAQVGAYAPDEHDSTAAEFDRKAMAAFAQLTNTIRRGAFANCWHASEYESAAMWNLYANRGIAIRSTVLRLARSVRDFERAIEIRKVLYADHDVEEINEALLVLYKRHFYRHEQEIRAYFLNLAPPTADQGQASHPLGISVPCDLIQLLAEIRLAPNSPTWFADAVKSVLERYHLISVPVQQSEADAAPTYLAEADTGIDEQTIVAWAKDVASAFILGATWDYPNNESGKK